MHIRGIHIVFFIPGGGRQNDIGKQTGTGHTEIKRDQQIELALNRGGLPFHLFRLNSFAGTQRFALDTAVGAQQIFEHVLMTFPGGAEQVRAPDK